MPDVEYAKEPVKLRIFHDGYCWNLDAVDADGKFTESCWTSFDWNQLIGWIPKFIEDVCGGVVLPIAISENSLPIEEAYIEPDSLVTFTILAIVFGALAYFGWHVIKAGTFWS